MRPVQAFDAVCNDQPDRNKEGDSDERPDKLRPNLGSKTVFHRGTFSVCIQSDSTPERVEMKQDNVTLHSEIVFKTEGAVCSGRYKTVDFMDWILVRLVQFQVLLLSLIGMLNKSPIFCFKEQSFSLSSSN